LDLKDIHDRLDFLGNKQANFWSPEEKDAKLHLAQMEVFNLFKSMYGKNQEATDALSPFKVQKTFSTSDTANGLLQFNSDYMHFLGGYIQYYDNAAARTIYQELVQVNEDELGERLNSQLDGVSAQKPVYTTPGFGKIQLYPQQTYTGYAWYLSAPEPPKFAYTMDGRVPVYNKNNSKQMLWGEAQIERVIIKALQLLGVNISDSGLVQYTAAKEQQI
jgi:hypothetical protein